MTTTFALMPDEALRRVPVTGKMSPDMEKKLIALGKALGERPTFRGGKSAALNAVLQLADYLGWFDDPDKFYLELRKAELTAMERTARKK